MADRETIIETGDGGAAGIIAGMVLIALVAIGLFIYFGNTHAATRSVDIDVPKITVNVSPDGQ